MCSTVRIPLILQIPRHGENHLARFTEQRVRRRANQMPTAETNVRPTEQELVERWRAEELERAGYPPAAAAELAARTDVDLHRAAELLQRGCTIELALQILI
jgi:hypothetical protein